MNDETQQIVCSHLCKQYTEAKGHITVLDDVNLVIDSADMIGIIGSSGAGKSTLLHLLGGLDKPTGGHVNVAGHELSRLNPKALGELRNRFLGFVYQFHHLLPEFVALENVCMPLLIRGMAPAKAVAAAREMIAKVGLTQRETHRIGELSGGERQRIAIARALVARPKWVLADEPTGNLDQGTAARVFELMLQLNQALKIGFVIVTHNQALANRMNRVFRIEDAQLRQVHLEKTL